MSKALIHHLFLRNCNDGQGDVTCLDRDITTEEALKYFINAELAFGSRIVSVTPTEIKTTSACMGVVDNMTFSGAAEAMQELFEIATIYNTIPCVYRDVKFPTTIAGRHFSAMAGAFLSDLATANGLLYATIVTAVTNKAEKAVVDKLNRKELIDLYLMLACGEITTQELEQAYC